MHELGKENTNIFTENTYVFFRILIYRLELKRHSSVYTHKVTVRCLRKIWKRNFQNENDAVVT